MSYCTASDIASAFSESVLISLTDDDNAGTVNEQRVFDAIARADAEIDGYIGKSISLPLTTVPAIVKRLSIDIAGYHLYSRKQYEELKERHYLECVRLLKDISDGKITLGSSKVTTLHFYAL